MVKVHREGEGEALLENEKLKDVVNTLEEYHTKALAAEVRKREAAERDLEVLRRQYERLSTSVENGQVFTILSDRDQVFLSFV